MARRLLTLLSALSLLLCVAAAVVWVRSYFVGEALIWNGVRREAGKSQEVLWSVNVWSAQGGVGVYHDQLWMPAGFYARADTFDWARDRMRVYPYVPIPQLQRGRYVQGLGVTLFEWRGEQTWPTMDLASPAASNPARERVLILPYWLPVLLTALLPAWAALHWRRARRTASRLRGGLCPQCGYDLRATPGRCPECGAAAAVKLKQD